MARAMREDFVVRTLASGDSLSISKFTFKGSREDAPAVYLQANVHGSEIQGNAVIFHLMAYLQRHPPLGEFIFVPQANPMGLNQKSGEYTAGRFDSSSGNNWNRCYWGVTCDSEAARRDEGQVNLEQFVKKYPLKAPGKMESSLWENIKRDFKGAMKDSILERLLRQQTGPLEFSHVLGTKLQSLAVDADIVLDLHTGPASSRYIYLPEYALASAIKFNVAHMILIPIAFDGAMDEASFCPWWSLSQAFLKQGVVVPMDFEAFTLEVGSQEMMDLQEAKIDAQNIIAYLKFKGAIAADSPDLLPMEKNNLWACHLKNYKGLFSTRGGMVDFTARPGEFVGKGKVLCRFLNFKNVSGNTGEVEEALTDILAPEDLLVINHFPSAILHEGMELYRYFTGHWPVVNK